MYEQGESVLYCNTSRDRCESRCLPKRKRMCRIGMRRTALVPEIVLPSLNVTEPSAM